MWKPSPPRRRWHVSPSARRWQNCSGPHWPTQLLKYRDSHQGKGRDYDCAFAADPFDAYIARRERDILLAILPQLYRPRLRRSLDFACGTGRITQLLDAAAEESFAVDVSESMVAEARPKCPRTRFVVHDVTETPLPIAPVELVTAFGFGECAPGDPSLSGAWRLSRPQR